MKKAAYIPRGNNLIQRILKAHFPAFEECYEERHAQMYGSYRIIRIKEAVLNVLDCGDYEKGIARIKCTNPECKHEYFRRRVIEYFVEKEPINKDFARKVLFMDAIRFFRR